MRANPGREHGKPDARIDLMPSLLRSVPTRLLCLLVVLTQGIVPFLHAHAGVPQVFAGKPLHLHLSLPAAGSNGVPAIGDDEGRVITAAPEYRRDNALLPIDLPLAITGSSLAALIEPGRAPILVLTTPAYRFLSVHRHLARAPPAV